MARRTKSGLPFVKTTLGKGRRYWYFDTGTTNERGKKIFTRLPDIADKAAFGSAYSSLMGHRTRRASAAAEMTVTAMINLYRMSQKFKELAPGSKQIYNIYLAELEAMLGMAPADDVKRADIVLLVDKRAKHPGAANMILKIARAIFKWARGRGHITADPCSDIDLNDLGEHQPWPEELLAMALASDDDRIRLSTHLLYYTAQRIGDMVRMKFSDIRDGTLFVRQQKTGKELDIPVHSALLNTLAETGRHIGPIVITNRGTAIAASTLRAYIQAWAKGLGYEIVPHGLRKNAVNALLEAECSVAQTAAISGQTMQVVEHYAKLRDQRKLAAGAMRKWEGNER